jgi:hypothetical protein
MKNAPIVAVETVASDQRAAAQSYINWPSIIAGSFIAAATLLVLMPFGAAIGLSLTSAIPGQGTSAGTVAWLAIIWFAFMHLYSVGLGGYVTGRLRPVVAGAKVEEIRFRDGISGLVMWGLGIIVSMTLVFSTIANVAGGAASTASQALGPAVSSAIQAAAPSLSADYLTDVFLRGQVQPGATNSATPRSDADVRAEIGRVLANGAANGDVTDDDRRYIAGLITQRTGAPEAEALARVNTTIARAKQIKDTAAAKAKETAEAVRKSTASAAFWMTLLSLLTGVAAWYFAQLGGQHRDENRYGAYFGSK